MPTDRAFKIARSSRRNLSEPEALLWQLMRRSGLHIRRQHPIGPYVVDFYCATARLVIEVDGWSHLTGDRPSRDEARSAYLAERGYLVHRLWARDVLRDPAEAADSLLRLCHTPPPRR